MTPEAAAAINTFANIAGGVMSGATTRRAQNRQYEQNKGLAKYQYDLNMQAWNMQNAYNSPAAQMQRFKDAGLNPNLMYGNGSASAGLATDYPKYQAPKLDYDWSTDFNLGHMIGQYMDVRLKAAQVNNMEKQASLYGAEEALKIAQAAKTGIDTRRSELDYNLQKDIYKYSVEAAEANLRNLVAQTENTIYNTANVKERFYNIIAERNKTMSEIALNKKILSDRNRGIYTNTPWWLKTSNSLTDGLGGLFSLPGLMLQRISKAFNNSGSRNRPKNLRPDGSIFD